MRSTAPLLVGLIAASALCGFVLATAGFLVTIAGLGGIALIVAGLARPRLLVWPALFAIYANLPAVAVKFHGIPPATAVLPLLLLIVPLAYYLLVRRERLIVDATLRLMFVFLGVLLLSTVLARDLGVAFQWITVFLGEGILIYFVVLNVVRDRTTLRSAVWALLIAGAFMGGFCVYSELTNSYHTDLGGLVQRRAAPDEQPTAQTAARDRIEGTFSTSRRASGPIGEINRFAQVLLVLLPLAYFRFRGETHLALRLAAAAAGGLILAGFLLTYSRSAFLVLVGLVALVTVTGYLRPSRFIAVALALLVVVLLVPGYRDRIQSIANVRGVGSASRNVEADGATRGRLTEMLAAFNVFVDHPMLGVGPGQYAPFYSVEYQLRSPHALRYIPEPRRAHSLYLELAAETGVLGLVSFSAIAIVLLLRLKRASTTTDGVDPDMTNLALGCWFGIVGYLAMGVFLHMSYQRYFWLLLAVGGATAQLSRQRPEAEVNEWPRLHW